MRRPPPAVGLLFFAFGLCFGCSKGGDTKAATPAPQTLSETKTSGSAPASDTASRTHTDKAADAQAMPMIKAHRGASTHAPENTVAAVKLGFASGADAAEVDVRISSDGVPVIIHDEDTERVAGRKRKVASQTLAELKELDVGSWMSPEFSGERIATLEEILLLVPAGKTLFVEIKDGPAAVAVVLESIKNTKSGGSFAIESFSLEVLEAVGHTMPDLPRHWTISAKESPENPKIFLPHDLALVAQAKALGFAGLAIDGRGLRPEFAEAARKADLELAVWTINDPRIARGLRSLPITYVETDDPALIRKALHE